MNLYTKNSVEKKNYANLIYIFNFLFFVIAFFRFYIPVITSEHLLILNIFIIFTLLLIFALQIRKFGFSENFLTMAAGILIFFPVCFVSNPVHAIIMGVTMHYSQYLFLTSKVIKKRSDQMLIKIKIIYKIYSYINFLFSDNVYIVNFWKK